MCRKVLLIVSLMMLPTLGQDSSAGGGRWVDAKIYILYPIILAIILAIPTTAWMAWKWHEMRGHERLKDKIMQYLDGKGAVRKAEMVKEAFNGKEPRNLNAVLKELADEGTIKDLGIDRRAPFEDIRRLR